MKNIRCWFRATISRDEIFKSNIIDIQLSDFYGCLKDCMQKPLSLRIRMDPALNSYCTITNDEISNHYAKNTMHQLRQAVIAQAEQFFDEFYHYNFDDMRMAIKECIEMENKK
jgi:hypothetical protein